MGADTHGRHGVPSIAVQDTRLVGALGPLWNASVLALGVDGKPRPSHVSRSVTRYDIRVVVGFRHKGLRRLFETGSTRGIQSDHEKKLRRILAALDAADRPADLDLPSFRLHPLKGKREGQWSVWVNGNWWVTFRFDGHDVTDIDDVDDHEARW